MASSSSSSATAAAAALAAAEKVRRFSWDIVPDARHASPPRQRSNSIVRRLVVDTVMSKTARQIQRKTSSSWLFVTPPAEVSFAKIVVHEALHEGLASSVYRASTGAGFVFALKTIAVPYENARQHREMIDAILLAEALGVHANIVAHLGHDMRDVRCYRQFMAYHPDNLMRHLSAASPPLEAARVIDAAVQIARALTFIHAAQIIHRDVKCENVLLEIDRGSDENAQPREVFKLSDLLECCAVVRGGVYRANIGTPGFMAPEVYSDTDDECAYGQSADVWSFGMLLRQLVTREFPPPEVSRSGVRPRLPEGADVCSPAISSLYVWCTERAPSMRTRLSDVLLALEALEAKK